ncbi:MAG TPA: UvrD-helicase domain-containing protein [Gaiellales bacterium]|jgi:ATP-dependent exoDNAse (exonuclease V) beta subunit|nr:UvrD-helicase domain-containing protein [Gaiellales bacterium]
MIATRTWNRGQAEAIERRGRVFVSAGAGTGKTSVLIERVVRRLLEGTPLDHLLVITFTERAADELKRRIRVRLRELEMLDAEAAVESAWISTIHGLCARVLRAHALEAGIDPSFAVASDTEMRILQSEAFAQTVEAFGGDGDPARLDLLARYGQDRLRRIVAELHGRLRGVGLPLELRPHRAPDPDSAEDAEERSAAADLALIEQLLVLFDGRYQAVKDLRGRLDFDDLELVARDLLRAKPGVAAGYRERFAEVMVDEFQDTNRLQVELVELVCGGDLFLVGDEFQSIYRFRRADVEVYREQRAMAGDAVIALDENYRSRPHVLDLVNEAYGREFGAGYHGLVAAGDFDGDPPAPEVELLLTDVRACREDDIAWRQAEAAAIALRVRELVDAGACGPGGVVLLFEAGTDAGTYEDALQQQHLPTVRATGRGYYGQQEVGDLIAYLRLLINRTDDRALLSVLASPLVGMSNDGLGLIRLATRRAAAIGAFEPARWPQALTEADNRLGQAFKLRYDRLVERQPGYSLERLCEAIVAEHDFDLALLARPDGDRRLANVRKLVRLAREYEQLRGPDLEGFVRFCEEQADLAAREGEAAIADEGGDAVVLMTVHSAKGLEFPVVVVADAGRRLGGRGAPDVLLDRRGRVAIRACPDTGTTRPALGLKELGDDEKRAEREEGRRRQYVAMTRAQQHLIVSGGFSKAEDDTPVAALCRVLEVGLHSEGLVEVGGTRVDVRVVGVPETAAATLPDDVPDQMHLFAALESPLPELPELQLPAAPPGVSLRRISYSGLALYDRCGYRFYAQRILRLPERQIDRPQGEGMAGVEIGDAVHLLLERDDQRWRELYPHATAEDEARIERMLSSWAGSQLAERVRGLQGVSVELPFAFAVDEVLIRGRFDLYHRGADGTALVVDYKTNLLGDRTPDELVERSYGHQVAIYALAVLLGGATSVEVTYAFLDRPDAVVVRSFGSGDLDSLRDGVRASMAPILEGRFLPRPGPWCNECPALDLLCAGPALPS